MLTKLLKYEFKSTVRTFGCCYAGLLACSLLLGLKFSFQRWDAEDDMLMNLLMIVYMALMVAMLVITAVNIVTRFSKNLLGQQGYLMHTLPVTPVQLVASKTITSMVWCIGSALAALVSMLVVGLVASLGQMDWIDLQASLDMVDWGEFFRGVAGMGIMALSALFESIVLVYAACMIGSLFNRHRVMASLLSYFGIQILLSFWGDFFDHLTGYRFTTIHNFWGGVAATAIPQLILGAAFFALTAYLMRDHLNLE